jgi:hypothetical protein
VHQDYRAFDVRFQQFRVELSHLFWDQHAFVDDRPAGKTWDVELVPWLPGRVTDCLLGPFPDHVELAFEGKPFCGTPSQAAGDEGLTHEGPGTTRRLSQRVIAYGNSPPAQELLSFFPDNGLETRLTRATVLGIHWQKHHGNTVLAWVRKGEAVLMRDSVEEAVGKLHKYACPVTGCLLGTASAPVVKILQYCQGLLYNGA